MHKHVPLETTSLVQIYLQCLQMNANVCTESIFQLTTIEEINVAQKRNFSHLWMSAMHSCVNALTAAQEIVSASLHYVQACAPWNDKFSAIIFALFANESKYMFMKYLLSVSRKHSSADNLCKN